VRKGVNILNDMDGTIIEFKAPVALIVI